MRAVETRGEGGGTRAPRLLWNRAFFRGSGHGSNGGVGRGGKHSCHGYNRAHGIFPKDPPDEKYSRSDEFRIKEAQLESRKPERARRLVAGAVQLEFRLASLQTFTFIKISRVA